jgi:centromere protein C
MSFYANNRYAGAEDGASRVASSSRRTTRTSDVDFDQLPSHRPRKSGANGSPLRPSSLSQSHLPDPEPDDDHDQGGMDGDFEDYGPQEDDYAPQNDTPRRSSFTQIDRDEEDEDGDLDNAQADPESPIRNSSKDKGNGRAQIPDSEDNQPDPAMEDAIAQGLEDVELDVPSEDEDELPRSKKPRTEKQAQKSKTPRGRSQKREKVERERSRMSDSTYLLYLVVSLSF